MHVLVVEFMIHAPRVADFEAAIVDNARQSLGTEPGCHQFDVCRDPDEPRRFFLYELYEDDAAVQAHLASPHFQQMNALTADWVERKSVWRYRRVAP